MTETREFVAVFSPLVLTHSTGLPFLAQNIDNSRTMSNNTQNEMGNDDKMIYYEMNLRMGRDNVMNIIPKVETFIHIRRIHSINTQKNEICSHIYL